MPYPDNLLARGEQVIVNKNPHWKVLVLPVVFFLLIVGGGVALLIWLQNWQYFHIAWIVIAVVMLVGLIWLVAVPVVRWRTEHFAISNHHVFFRTGLLSRREHQIPLSQIANMETEVTFWGRLMGYGTLVVESSADAPLKFHNIAELPKTQATLNQLIRDERDAWHRGRRGEEDLPDGPAPDEAPDDANRYRGTYLEDRADPAQHPEPRQTPTRVFGAAPDGDRYDPAPYGADRRFAQEQPASRYEQPQYGQPPQYSQPHDGQPQDGQPAQYGQPQYGQPHDDRSPYGQPQQYGQPQYGAPQYGTPQYGAPQYGTPQYGTPQYGTPQYGQPTPGAGAHAPQYGPPQDHPDPPTDPWLNRPAAYRPDATSPDAHRPDDRTT